MKNQLQLSLSKPECEHPIVNELVKDTEEFFNLIRSIQGRSKEVEQYERESFHLIMESLAKSI